MDLESWTQPFYILGWIMAAGVALLFVTGCFSGRRRQQLLTNARSQEVALLNSRISKIREARNAQSEGGQSGWTGFANFVVSKKVPHAESGICSFYLKPKDKRLKLAPFKPGQHLVFQLPVRGEAQPITRRYSLSDSANDEYYRISVKRLDPPTDKPEIGPGRGSSFLHDHVAGKGTSRENCHLFVAAPQGSFHLNPRDPLPVVLIGGGVGVTPMLSMFNAILRVNPEREVWLFYGVRHSGEDILDEAGVLVPNAQELIAKHPNLHLQIHYSRPLQRDAMMLDANPARYRRGRVTVDVLKQALPNSNYRFYICGPEEMMDQVESDLEKWGVPDEHVFSERFGPPKRKPGASLGTGAVGFARSGTSLTFGGDDGCLLDTAERAGVPIANDCRAGSCGSCLVPLLAGEVTYPRKTALRPRAGHCLTCSCVPKGDIVLDC